MVSVSHLKNNEDLKKWDKSFKSWFSKNELIIPQHFPDWKLVFESMSGKFQYEILIAHKELEILEILPFVIYNGLYGKIINSIPLIGYGGFVKQDTKIWSILIDKLIEIGKFNNCLSLTLSSPPYQENLINEYRNIILPDFEFENFYQFSILDEHPLKKLSKKRNSSFRSEINKAKKNNIVIKIGLTHEKWMQWYDLYSERYDEIGAVPYPREFFTAVYNEFAHTNRAKLYTAYYENRMIGGTLVLFGKKSADYFSSAYNSAFMKYYPGTYVLDNIFSKLLEEDYIKFNWQSSPGREGVYRFKERWGAEEGKHIYFTKVIGNIQPILSKPLESIKEQYKGIFVLPFNLWDDHSKSY